MGFLEESHLVSTPILRRPVWPQPWLGASSRPWPGDWRSRSKPNIHEKEQQR